MGGIGRYEVDGAVATLTLQRPDATHVRTHAARTGPRRAVTERDAPLGDTGRERG